MSIDFEKELMRGIPEDVAADFFIRIRGTVKEATLEEKWASLSPEQQDELLAQAVEEGLIPKEAMGQGGGGGQPGAPPPLPPTAQGQTMQPPPPTSLPPTAMGANAVKMGSEKTPKERAHEQIEIAREKHRHSRGELAGKHIGTLLGGAAGAVAGHRLGGHGVAGAAMGALAGRSMGKDMGKTEDAKKKFKHAAAKLGFAGNMEGNLPPEAEVGNEPDIHQYLAAEEMGGSAEEANAAEYYKRKFEEATQNLQQTSEQADAANAMAEQLQTQVSGSQEQIQAAMQQAQMASQAAMQNVQQAHEMAMTATQQAMTSQSEVLKQKQLAAAMKMGITQVKDQVMNVLANDPTDQLASQLTSPPPGSGGMVGGEQPGASQDPNAQGGNVQNPSTQADAQGTAKTDQTQGAADQAAGAEGQPNSAGSGEGGEEVSDARSGKSEGEGSQSTSKGSTKVEIKQGSVASFIRKKAGVLPPLSLPGALGGGAIGAGVGTAYAHMNRDKLRGKIDELESKGTRSFSESFNLAQSKARLLLGEASEKHPVATALGVGAAGALTGALGGHEVIDDLGAIGKNLGETFRTMKAG
jgi:hypothetical protein